MIKLEDLRFKVKYLDETGKIRFGKVTELRFNKSGVSYIYFTDEGKEKQAVSNLREDVELLMYSNYYDKNKVRICAGDIIKKRMYDGLATMVAVKFNPGNGFVVYDPECCEACRTGDGCIDSLENFILGDWKKVEVIGNIFRDTRKEKVSEYL